MQQVNFLGSGERSGSTSKVMDVASEDKSEINAATNNTSNSTNVATNKVSPQRHSPVQVQVLNLLNCKRRRHQMNESIQLDVSPTKQNTTMETERSNETNDCHLVGNDHNKHIDYDTDDGLDMVGASTLISGLSAPSLDGMSVATDSEMPFSHIVDDGRRNATMEDDMSSMNSSVVNSKFVDHSDNDGEYSKDTSYGRTGNDDGLYAPSLEQNTYRTEVYAGDMPKRLVTTLVHPQPTTKEADSAPPASDGIVYEMQEDTVSRSFLTKNSRSGRKLRAAGGRLGGVLGVTPIINRRRDNGKDFETMSLRNIATTNARNSSEVGVHLSPLSISGVSSHAAEEGAYGSSGADHESGSEYNSIATSCSKAQFTTNRVQQPKQTGGKTHTKRPSVTWSEGTSDICSIEDGILSLADLHSQQENHSYRHTDRNRDDGDYTDTKSIGIQPMMYRVEPEDVAAVREVGTTGAKLYHASSHDNPSTVVGSADGTPNNTSGDDSTGPCEIPDVVATFIDGDKQNANTRNHKRRNEIIGDATNKDKKGCLCIPHWLQRSPLLLKLIIIGVLLIFLAAILVAVSKYSIIRSTETKATAAKYHQETQTNKTSIATTASPTSSPSSTRIIDTYNNTEFGDDDTVSQQNITVDEEEESAPSTSPSIPPTSAFTMGPTSASRTDETVLYFLVGPYRYLDNNMSNGTTTASLKNVADAKALRRIPKNNGKSFMVHLGDWNSPNNTKCSEQTYIDVEKFYRNSSVPVYFVLGDNEYSECDNPSAAKDYWVKYLTGYETKYWSPPDWTVWRQGVQSSAFRNYYENFDFTNSQNLAFCGLSVADSHSTASDMTERDDANFAWILASYQFYRGTVDAIVILIHDAIPGSSVANRIFYTILLDRIKTDYADMNFIIVHQNINIDQHSMTSAYDGIPNLSTIAVNGSAWPPLQVSIKTSGDGSMPRITLNETEWYYQLWGMKDPM